MLQLFREEWREEVVLGRQELEVIMVLGMGGFLKVEEKLGRSVEEEDTIEERGHSESEQDTERRVEEGIKDSEKLEEREHFEYELEQGHGGEMDSSIDYIIADEIDKLVGNENSVEDMREDPEEKICPKCGTTTTNLLLHIAEVHLEEELEEEMIKVFPRGCDLCVMCGQTFINEYEKKEHTSLQHPWDTLTSMAKELNSFRGANTERSADIDEISDNAVAWEDQQISDDEADTISHAQEHNATNVANDVVNKITTKTQQPKYEDCDRYSCNKCDYTWKMRPVQKEIQYLIKSHTILQHYYKEMENGLKKCFKGNDFTLCESILKRKEALKKHLIVTHRYFDDMISNDFESVFANATETSFGRGLKRKGTQSAVCELKSKYSVDHVGEDDIYEIQSRIEFIDSYRENEKLDFFFSICNEYLIRHVEQQG